MIIHNNVLKNTYYDSITLMFFSSRLENIPGVIEAAVMMGTDHNKALMIKSGVLTTELSLDITPNDLVIGISAESQDAIEQAKIILNEQMENKKRNINIEGSRSKSIFSAVKKTDGLNFCIISVPGKYAKNEAITAMKNGMHVLLFSDNVSIEDEVLLKDYAVTNNLLMMGPDCGTAIINGVSLGFANVIKQGNIGIVAAAGTGLQEASVIINKLGGGVSQALGTGGRDLKELVGGKMMLMALDALNNDEKTEVIVIISKPPTEIIMEKILLKVKQIEKPVVACFLGGNTDIVKEAGAVTSPTIEEAAINAVTLASHNSINEFKSFNDLNNIKTISDEEIMKFNKEQKYIRGLYSGGSLCYETLLLLEKSINPIYSNIAINKDNNLKNIETSERNSLIDMGEDYFTDGMPHPMIDMRLRVERIKKEALDIEVAVILLDCVLGFGCHEDPAGALCEAINEARRLAGNRYICFISSVCGTDDDIQNKKEQERKLKDAGVIVMPSNAQAALLSKSILEKICIFEK